MANPTLKNSARLSGSAHRPVASVIAGATKPSQIESNAKAAEWTLTADDLAAGTIYFACSYYPAGDWGHCVEGQAISVTVSDEVSAGAPAAAPRLMLAAAAAAGLMMYWV